MKIVIAFLFVSIPSMFLTGNKELASNYINNYKDIAVEEMHRTGIPASIKLAQGLLESDWGRSDLATTANNHFGIKCGGRWDGKTFYKKDDDKDDRGRLIESCFRSFSSPMESYMAHSDFLTDPKKEYRYGFLFEYESTDYISWAKGLKKSGYATDPNYPKKLITIIEKYNLSRFDTPSAPNTHTYTLEQPKSRTKKSKRKRNRKGEATTKDIASTNIKITAKKKRRSNHRKPTRHISSLAYDIDAINNCRMVVAKGGESIAQLSNAVGLSEDEILGFNEIYDQSSVVLEEGEVIYIEKKKRSYRGGQEYHKVQEGETMESIAQLYGMRLKSLYAKNRMPKNSVTFPGVKLSIRKTVSLDERPQFKMLNSSRRHKLLFEDDDSVQ